MDAAAGWHQPGSTRVSTHATSAVQNPTLDVTGALKRTLTPSP